MEEHGLHNALGVDPYTGYDICLRAVEMSGGILLPPVPLAPAGDPGYSREQLRSRKYELYPPSLWLSRELCEGIYVELMESMADIGFRVCIAFGGHWPADILLQEIERKYAGKIGTRKIWGGGTIRILDDILKQEMEKEPRIGDHGMMWETSMVAAIRPDWVEVKRAKRITECPLPSQLKGAPPDDIAYVAYANPEYGKMLLNVAAECLAKLAKEMSLD
jgi:creatinine amidohydrolase/Fe(II)-dependent formamide hydrolase-like protein